MGTQFVEAPVEVTGQNAPEVAVTRGVVVRVAVRVAVDVLAIVFVGTAVFVGVFVDVGGGLVGVRVGEGATGVGVVVAPPIIPLETRISWSPERVSFQAT